MSLRTVADINLAERQRILFMKDRDGLPAAIAFAKQGMLVYRKALAQRTSRGARTGYGLTYRRELVVSLLVYRSFLRIHHEPTYNV